MTFDINQIRRNLLIGYPLFGSVISNVNFISTVGVETAATDGKNILYNEDYFSKLTKSEQTFLLAHEILHISFKHMQRKQNRDLNAWNIATDAVINALLVNDGLTMPKGMIYMEEAIKYNCEELYEIIISNKANIVNECKNHTLWNNDVVDNNQINETKEFGQNKVIRENRNRQLKEELIKESLGTGNERANTTRNIDGVQSGKQIIDWRRILKETIGYEVDWSYRDSEIEDGVVSSHLIDIPTPLTEILLDVSGSIDDELLKTFLKECKNILKTSRLKVGCFDTKFYGFVDINNEKDLDYLSFAGGGGTDFEVARDSFSHRVDNKIIFTDGRGHIPNDTDIIWMIYNNHLEGIKGSKIIEVNELKCINKRKKGM